jgi:serine/threonine protein kinase
VADETTLGDTGVGTPPPRPPATSELIGAMLSGRYLVTRKVGQGGMGAVYEATHTLIGKRVAVKVLLEKYARREAIVQRLEQEARLASSCQNEHIIDITDFGTTEDGRTFVVMEYLEGESLGSCASCRRPPRRSLPPTPRASSTATSSPRTCSCSAARTPTSSRSWTSGSRSRCARPTRPRSSRG